MKRSTVALVLALLALASPAGAARYYAKPTGNDDLDGTSLANAWKTPRHALVVMQPGDSCSFEVGHYNDSLTVSVRDGTSGTGRIKLYAVTAGACSLSAVAVNLDDSAFGAVGGLANTYAMSGLTAAIGADSVGANRGIQQSIYADIDVNDPNVTRFTLRSADGPLDLTQDQITTPAGVDTIDGSFCTHGDSIYVNPLGVAAVGNATTDLWFTRNAAAVTLSHDYIVLDGFRFMHADGAATALNLTAAAAADTISNCYFGDGGYIVQGDLNVCRSDTTLHVFQRTSPAWTFFDNCQGYGFSLPAGATHNSIIGGLCGPNWNLWTTKGDSTTIDGLIAHGAPNHSFIPEDVRGLTVRNNVVYNAADYNYLVGCSDVLFENCTFAGGIFLQNGTGAPGHVTARNCIFEMSATQTGAQISFLASVLQPDTSYAFDHCLFLTVPSGEKILRHRIDASTTIDLSLAEYQARMISHPTENFFRQLDGCQEIFSGFTSHLTGGVWAEDTDTWDFSITGTSSAAYNTGTTSGATTDYQGQPRPMASLWDVGADEFLVTATTGACCIGTGCGIVADQAACQAAGGTYLGDGTTCDGSPCAGPTGACCIEDGTCSVKTQENCEGGGGTWEGAGTTCSPNPCPQPPTGACCLPDGSCLVKSAIVCASQGGTYRGDGVPCGAICSTTIAPYRFSGHRFGIYPGKLGVSGYLPYLALLGVSPDSIWLPNQIPDERGWKTVKPARISFCQQYALPPQECYECNDSHCDDYLTWDLCCYYYPVGPRSTLAPVNALTTQMLPSIGYDPRLPDSVCYKILTGHYRGNVMDSVFSYVDWALSQYPTKKQWLWHNEGDLLSSWLDTPTNYLVMADSVRNHIRATCTDCEVGISFSLPGFGGGSNPASESWWTAIASHPNSFDFLDLHYYTTRYPPDTLLTRWNRTAPGKEFFSLEVGVMDSTLNGVMPDVGGTPTRQARDLPRLLTMLFGCGFQRLSVYGIDTSIGKNDALFLHNALLGDNEEIKPAFYAYKFMISMLDRFTRCDKQCTGQYRYVFNDGRRPVYVCWSGRTCPLELLNTEDGSARVQMWDYMGNVIPFHDQRGSHTTWPARQVRITENETVYLRRAP